MRVVSPKSSMDFIVYIRNAMANIPTIASIITGYLFIISPIPFRNYCLIPLKKNLRQFLLDKR